MKVLIVGYHFYPQNTPRAFRTYELVREMIKRDIEVDLVLPRKEVFVQTSIDLQEKANLNVFYLGNLQSYKKPGISNSLKRKSVIRNFAKKIYRYFNPYTETRKFIKFVYNHLKNNSVEYDLVLAIAHPFSTLVGTAKAIRKNPILAKCPVKIAEYSDPFTLQKDIKVFPIYKFVDRQIARTFDFISVPTQKAIVSFAKIKTIERIMVIPQGFDFNEIVLSSYVKNDMPYFGYAGVFYEKIRNPSILFDYLLTLKIDFRFYLYTSYSNTDTREIIEMYKVKLGEKFIVHYDVPRLMLLKELSKLDFLINVDNLSENQSPSKIIDYVLTKRPVFSFTQKNFDKNKFQRFLEGDYKDALLADISKYDIKHVVDQFLNIKK